MPLKPLIFLSYICKKGKSTSYFIVCNNFCLLNIVHRTTPIADDKRAQAHLNY